MGADDLTMFERLRRMRPSWAKEKLAAHGAVKLSPFLDATAAAELRRVVIDIYDAMSSASQARDEAFVADKEFADSYDVWRGVWLKHLPTYLAAAHPDLAKRYSRLQSQICSTASRKFSSKFRFLPERSFFRRHIGVALRVPWHVDFDAAAVVNFGVEGFNIWMPIDSVGGDSPSLDVVYDSHKVMRKLPLLTGSNRYRDEEFVSNIGSPATTQLELGDALVIDLHTLHRTQQVGSPDTVRTACEFRFVY
jgi:hypothetical protein